MMRGLHRKRNRKTAAFLLAAGLVLSLVGCGSSTKEMYSEDTAVSPQMMNAVSYDTGSGMFEREQKMEAAEAGAEKTDNSSKTAEEIQQNQNDRKLIKTVNMDVETKEFDQVMPAIENEVTAMGGYIENMNTYNGSSYSSNRETRYADMTIRIPRQQLDTFLDTVSGIVNVTRRSDNVEDVTLAYVDLESHRDALRTEQERLLELLEKAESIEDIIAIESRLSDVRYQLESMESQLRTYDNKVDYSTVYLNINEVEVFTPASEETVWERVANGFVASLKNIGNGFKEFFVGLLINLPYLLLVAVFVLILIFIIIRLNKKTSGKTKGSQIGLSQQDMPKEKEQ